MVVLKLRANMTPDNTKDSEKYKIFGTSESARFILHKVEGERSVFHEFDNVKQFFLMDGKNTPMENYSCGIGFDWEITITNERIVVWSPLAMGFAGVVKEKPGLATGGYLLFEDLRGIQLVKTQTDSINIGLISEIGMDRVVTYINMQLDNAGSFFNSLLTHLIQSAFITSNFAVIPVINTIKKYQAVINKEYPQVKKRGLTLLGALVFAYTYPDEYGEDVLDPNLTDLEGYKSVGIEFPGSSIQIDTAKASKGMSAAPQEQHNRFCARCGYEVGKLGKNAHFCPKCGTGT